MVSFDTCRLIIRKLKADAAFLARKNIFYVLRKTLPVCKCSNIMDGDLGMRNCERPYSNLV